ncbi:MAG: O-antigen ligase family protein, partial [Pseudobutyrivibrio sp.]|nr:O-antigen ligase family protein [Pseudobutyrivibrio sp.]
QKLFGRGTGSFLQAYLYDYSYGIDAIEMGLYSNEDAHNIYLQFLCEYGVVGVGIAFGAIIYRLRTRFSSGDLFLQLRAVAFIGAMVSSAFLVVQGITLGFFGVIF